jgi:Uma2 family endonuclease
MSDFANVLQTIARMSDAERRELFLHLQRSGEFSYPTDTVEEPRPVYGGALKYMTREEFFEFQEQSAITYEYVNGILRAMSGPTLAHSVVTRNIFRIVDARLRGGPCQAVWGVQLKLTLGEDEIVYEPDLYVSCDRSAWDEKWIANPKFVLEVSSPSTQRIDRCEKLVNYRRAATVEEYVIASQKRAELEIYRRADGWRQEIVKGIGAIAEFRSLDVAAPLKEIYDSVPFRSSMRETQDS